MQNEFKDSIKARLYDFKYTPFLSTYIFSWIFYNSKLLLIFTSSKLSVEKKIEMLSWGDINYLEEPLYIALGYVFVFPLATSVFYAVTLGYKALLNVIQRQIEDINPLPLKKTNEIRDANLKLALEYQDIREKLEKITLDYSNRESNLNSTFSQKEINLKKEYEDKVGAFESRVKEEVAKLTEELKTRLQYANNIIEEKNDILNEKVITIDNLTNTIVENKIKFDKLKPTTNENPIIDRAYKKAQDHEEEIITGLTINEIKVLATFYFNDSTVSEANFKTYVNKEYGLSKTLVELSMDKLTELDFAKVSSISGSRFYNVSKFGKNVLQTLFE